MKDFLESCVERYCELAKTARGDLKPAATPFHDLRIARPVEENEPTGRLQPIASKVLMKILFAARMARWDLLRATQSLASRVTKWSKDCDAGLHRLVCYINSSLEVRLSGFVGDPIDQCQLWLFSDSDFAGEFDNKSTTGCALFLVGPNTYFPLNSFSKKQTSVTMSSTESEVVAANQSIRAQGLPSLSLWSYLWNIDAASRKARPRDDKGSKDVVARIDPELDDIRYGDNPEGRSVANINGLNVQLPKKFACRVMEDNQASITLMLSGEAGNIRYTDRTQRVSFSWLKQQFERGLFKLLNVDTTEQVADVFTKPFTDRGKWRHALKLIAHTGDLALGKTATGNRKPESGAKDPPKVDEPPAKPSVPALEHPETIAEDLLSRKEFSYKALEKLARSLMCEKQVKTRSIMSMDKSAKYLVFGSWVHGGMHGVTDRTLRFPKAVTYLTSFVKHIAPKHEFTSVVINYNSQAKPHLDANNALDSQNLVVGFGGYNQGGLWVESDSRPDVTLEDKQGKKFQGYVTSVKHKPIFFSPKQRHATMDWEGERFSLTAYTTRHLEKNSEQYLKRLQQRGFVIPKANRKVLAATSDFDRVMVEFCCAADSYLGDTSRKACSRCRVIRVTKETDATKTDVLEQLAREVSEACHPRDEGGISAKPLLIFASLPCTGGCSWAHVNLNSTESAKNKVMEQRKLFKKLFKNLKKFIDDLKSLKPHVMFELPKSCIYWKWPVVRSFVKQFQLEFHHVDGCSIGIKDANGQPLKKTWRIASSVPGSESLDKFTCSHDHEHGVARGQALKKAERYTHKLTDAIHHTWAAATRTDHPPQRVVAVATGNRQAMAASSAQVLPRDDLKEYWYELAMWGGMASERVAAPEEKVYHDQTWQLYCVLPPQVSTPDSYNNADPSLARPVKTIMNLSDEGLKRLLPVPARTKSLILVSDSTTAYVKWGNKREKKDPLYSDMAEDLASISQGYETVKYSMVWGKTMLHVSKEVVKLFEALRKERPDDRIDILIVRSGNELTGRRGCIPGAEWGGLFPTGAVDSTFETVAAGVCQAADRVATLTGKPGCGDYDYLLHTFS